MFDDSHHHKELDVSSAMTSLIDSLIKQTSSDDPVFLEGC